MSIKLGATARRLFGTPSVSLEAYEASEAKRVALQGQVDSLGADYTFTAVAHASILEDRDRTIYALQTKLAASDSRVAELEGEIAGHQKALKGWGQRGQELEKRTAELHSVASGLRKAIKTYLKVPAGRKGYTAARAKLAEEVL